MAKETMALLDYLRNVGVDGDFLREAVRVLSQVVMEQEVGDQIGAGRYERTDSRKTYRNVDDMLQAIGLTRFDKSRVSRVCKELTKVVTEFRERELGGTYPYVWLDTL
jgi:transposase-like protein